MPTTQLLLETKLFEPPAQQGIVARPRLTSQLDQGLRCKLVLLCANAGFGKTTLLSEWRTTLSGSQVSLAWLSLDANDNDVFGFWKYIIAALEVVQPGVGEATRLALTAGQPPQISAVVTMLINAIVAKIDRDFALVLEDC